MWSKTKSPKKNFFLIWIMVGGKNHKDEWETYNCCFSRDHSSVKTLYPHFFKVAFSQKCFSSSLCPVFATGTNYIKLIRTLTFDFSRRSFIVVICVLCDYFTQLLNRNSPEYIPSGSIWDLVRERELFVLTESLWLLMSSQMIPSTGHVQSF